MLSYRLGHHHAHEHHSLLPNLYCGFLKKEAQRFESGKLYITTYTFIIGARRIFDIILILAEMHIPQDS